MRSVVPALLFLWISFVASLCVSAQISQPVASLEAAGETRQTQLPASAILSSPQCDSHGRIYVRYSVPDGDSYTSSVARIEADGSTQILSLASVQAQASHVFMFAADSDGSMYEILRAGTADAQQQASEYVRFDSDGELRSEDTFVDEFIPSALLPLPSGSFFASGIVLKEEKDGVSEDAVAGIFGADAHLQRRLHGDVPLKTGADGRDNDDAFLHAETVRLGGDGNIYALFSGDHAKIAVVTPAGQIIRELALQEPFETGVASDMWVSGGRLLVIYEGEADDRKDSFIYVLYDIQSGEVIRQYKPQFSGTPACFQDGQTLTVLSRQVATGAVGISTAELR